MGRDAGFTDRDFIQRIPVQDRCWCQSNGLTVLLYFKNYRLSYRSYTHLEIKCPNSFPYLYHLLGNLHPPPPLVGGRMYGVVPA